MQDLRCLKDFAPGGLPDLLGVGKGPGDSGGGYTGEPGDIVDGRVHICPASPKM